MTDNATERQDIIRDAASLYKTLQRAAAHPDVASLHYLWETRDIWTSPDPAPTLTQELENAATFLNEALDECPRAVRTSARWRRTKLALEPDMDDLFTERFGISRQKIELLTADPKLPEAPDQTLCEALLKLVENSKTATHEDLAITWQKTATALKNKGFILEDTPQPNLKYAVPDPGTP